MIKVLITEPISTAGLELLRGEPEFQVDLETELPAPRLERLIANYDALIVRSKTKVTRELIELGTNLKVIGRAGSGVDSIDVEAATSRGIVVMNTAGGNSVSVAEHTFALMLAVARKLARADASMKEGRWERQSFVGFELKGKTLGLIGLGRIGTEVARRARAFRMNVLAYDPYVSARAAQEAGANLIALDELLARSDIVSLHAPLTESTRGIIGRAALEKMKRGAILINCARGELVDEEALREALVAGKVAGAGLDVFAQEPPAGLELVGLPNVVATPHIGASTREAQELVGLEIAAQVRDFLKEGIIRNAVNFPSVTLEEYKRFEPYIRLSEQLGSFVSQVSRGRMDSIGVRYYGELTELNTSMIFSAAIKGVLKPILSGERVTMINAVSLAKSRGITLIESRSSRIRSFSNLISVKLTTDQGEEWAEGTVLHQRNLKLVSVDGIDIEAPLAGTMLLIRNQDTPGVIGAIGTILGNYGINIANFALGRSEQRGRAVGIVNVDSEVPDEVLREISRVPAVRFATVVRL